MASHAFGAYIDVESSSTSKKPAEQHTIPIAPQKALAKNYHSVPLSPGPLSPDAIELESIQWGTHHNNLTESGAATPSGYQTPAHGQRTPPIRDLEMSRPPSPGHENENNGVEALQSFSNPPINRYRMLSVCLCNFGNGLSDSAPGALLPYMEKDYNIGYAIVSMIFICNAVGFILAAFFIDSLREKLGRGKTLMIAQTLIACGNIPIICAGGHHSLFPVVAVSFFLLGLGMSINLAMGNTFAANLQNGTKNLGAMHGSYGLGGTLGPLIATAFVTKANFIWSRYYILVLGVTIANLVLAGWSFKNYEAEHIPAPTLLLELQRTASKTANATALTRATTASTIKGPSQVKAMLRVLKSRTVLMGALFIFAYQGAEVSISGWVVSFLLTSRDGNPNSVGYVTSGFWFGITVGRFLLSSLAQRVGEKLFVYFVIVLAAVFQLLVWQVPNVIGDAVAVSIVGVLLGPIYPSATIIFSRLIGRQDQVSALSVISAFGSSGGAVAPFITGLAAQASGTYVLHPIAISLFACMVGCWFALPSVRKRTE